MRSSSCANPASSSRMEPRERPSDGMPRMTSWVCAYGYALLMECLADRFEGRKCGFELDLARVVARAMRWIGLEPLGRFARGVRAPERERGHGSRGRKVGLGERRHGAIEDVGEDLGPRRGTRGTADERDLVDPFTGERFDGW